MRRGAWAVAIAFSGLLGAGVAHAAGSRPIGQPMGMSELPPQVRDEISRQARGRAVIGPISKRKIGKRTVYEAQLFQLGGHTNLVLTPEGKPARAAE